MGKELAKIEKPSSKDLINLINANQVAEIRNLDRLKQFLNIEPPASWLKENAFSRGTKYLPIDKVEILFDTIFPEWRVDIKSIVQLAQSIVAIVRVHYKNPVTNEWSYSDGTGAVALKTDKGYSAADLSHIKSDAVQTGAPSAVSYAIKDAAKHLGKIFGRDINRDDTVDFKAVYVNAERTDDVSNRKFHKDHIDIKYATLRSSLDNVDLLYAIGETETMSEDDVRKKLKELEERAEQQKAAKAEIKAERDNESARNYQESQAKLQYEEDRHWL